MNNTNSPNTLTDPLNWTTAIFMTVNAIFGIVCNTIIIYNFATSPKERTSFNLICAARAIANVVILGMGFLSLFVPLTIFGENLFPPVHHAIVITIINSLYTGLQNCGFLIAINRFVAMFFAFFYSKYFTPTVTFILTAAMFAFRFYRMGYDIIDNNYNQCFSTYSSVYLTWFPTRDPRCRNKYEDVFDLTTLLLVGLVLINIATFVKIYLFYKSTEMDSKEIKKRIRKNRILFSQTIIQDLAYAIDMAFTFKLRRYNNDILFTLRLNRLSDARAWTFLCGTVIWECVHAFDGFILMMFNERLSLLKKHLFYTSSTPSTVSTATRTRMFAMES
ncbi:hypothetical protein L3Y34_007876 [Caenorhabditis briggsae]|uniref:7TM GPCR serpentine receptor class x (Srx) domain-containing protein n=1 Tax=Caenorhabditis briggsae TaxID=6238 RepID=A0AAE9A128_CAEBR|nr:hypothetical protein L3Y34_007876 [Caenorhabditis briggsae]